ncbi:hypothetical protein K491DRAFT_439166 [Lophiostoma macrostomum CBS 122681]|uniref:Uncharacterized protein n=1 Tax=Lophiostoma macrostomum CBS 122681 TaxID=1314788 RepID=A0A6A6T5L8_9PLEO|nr:hypothetical protein K491DRAFT_439166 [Lophiostoma macrostomum CBS 122681]
MRLLVLLPLLSALALAAADGSCQCPQVKCPADNAVVLCQCLNTRETICHNHCPDYVPAYRPCPIAPPSPTPTPTQSQSLSLSRSLPSTSTDRSPTCTCHPESCPMIWPESCYCQNESIKKCYETCGGDEPVCQSCALQTSLRTLARRVPSPISTSLFPSTPTPTNPLCGGGRGNYTPCPTNFTCIKDPLSPSPGCGPECDGWGICVSTKMCGGFAGVKCPQSEGKEMLCVDDPRDECDPVKGGADCAGLCMYRA